MQLGLDPSSLIFIDETWIKTNMTRLRGRAPQGQRLVEKVPHGHWKTTTVIGALDRKGMRCSMVLDGPVNRDAFEAFVQQILCPALKAGDIVVMDNLSSHKRNPCQGTDRIGPGQAPVPATLFTRSQSDRTGVLQVQTTGPISRPPRHRHLMEGPATDAGPDQFQRRRGIFRALRLQTLEQEVNRSRMWD